MDGVRTGSSSCSSEAEQPQSRDSASSSSSSSGWRPRGLVFAPCVPQQQQQQREDVSAGKSPTLRAVVRKPVSFIVIVFWLSMDDSFDGFCYK